MKEVIVTVEADGTVKIEAVGFQGQACEKATRAIEQALGKVKAKTYKPEFRQINIQSQGN